MRVAASWAPRMRSEPASESAGLRRGASTSGLVGEGLAAQAFLMSLRKSDSFTMVMV